MNKNSASECYYATASDDAVTSEAKNQSSEPSGRGGQVTACNGLGEADYFPLTPAQERLWFHHEMDPADPAYNLVDAWDFEGELNLAAFTAALEKTVQRHEALRTRIVLVDGEPQQAVLWGTAANINLEYVDLASSKPTVEQALEIISERARAPFEFGNEPLFRATLYRLGSERHILFLNVHHIVGDEWSLSLLMRDLAAFYKAEAANHAAELPALACQFGDFAVWHRDNRNQICKQEDVNYWQEVLRNAPPAAAFPYDSGEPKCINAGGTTFDTVPASLAEQLRELSHKEGTTLFVTLLAAFKVLLSKYSGLTDLLVGTLFAGRTLPETEDVFGLFVNTHLVRTDVSGDPTFREVLKRTRHAVIGAMSRELMPFDVVVRQIQPPRHVEREPVIRTLFSLQPTPSHGWQFPGVRVSRLAVENGASKFDLTLLATESPEGLQLRCEFRKACYEAATVRQIVAHFGNVLRAIVEKPEAALSQIPVLSPTEERRILDASAGPVGPAESRCIHERVAAQASRTPNAIAVTGCDGDLSYAELMRIAGSIAARLRAQGAAPEKRVAICLPRTSRLIAAMLGVLTSGAAYVPIDPEYPDNRVQFMLEDSGAMLLVTSEALSARFEGFCNGINTIEKLLSGGESGQHGAAGVQASNLAYVIYTSGSTGKPKGVAIEHRNAATLLNWAEEAYSVEELARVMAGSSVCFDLSIFEIFSPLVKGGRVVVAKNALSLPELQEAGITLINTVPSVMRQLLDLRCIPSTVRTVNLAGEPLSSDLVDRIYSETSCVKVYDLYGPTETTTYSTGTLRTRGARASIGRPLPNERVYVLDSQLRPVPVGVVGEICISGVGVTRGYLNQKMVTAEKFVEDPFNAGQRMYRTGDIGRWLASGELEFHGRKDHQIKVRGFRIEPGEIEAVMRCDPAVADCVVVSEPGSSGEASLIAYLSVRDGVEFHGTAALREMMARQLPHYMLPRDYVVLAKLPLNGNGKVDRAALPKPETRSTSHAEFSAPRNPTEQCVAAIWQELLGPRPFGRDDDFFFSGGHSLLATQVVSRISKRLNVQIPLRAIFDHPTLAGVAQAVEEAKRLSLVAPPPLLAPAAARDLLKRLDTMSEEEVEQILSNPEVARLLA